MKASQFLRGFLALGLSSALIAPALSVPYEQAPATPTQAPAKPVAKAPVQGLFWTATNGTNTVYLLGSIHLASKKMYPLPPVIENAFKASKTLVVEVNLNNVDMSKVQSEMITKGLYPEGETLTQHLQPGDKKKLAAFCEKNNFPEMMVDRVRPWVAVLMLGMLPYMSAGMSPELGIDQYFLDKAKASGKKVDQCETLDFQLNLLAATTDKEALASLHQVLNQKTTPGAGMADTLQDAWIKGDGAAIEKFSESDRDPNGKDRKLLEDRNPNMADVAEKYLKGTTPCFFVVGSAHLLGKEGVVAILKQRGYTVTQVLNPPPAQ